MRVLITLMSSSSTSTITSVSSGLSTSSSHEIRYSSTTITSTKCSGPTPESMGYNYLPMQLNSYWAKAPFELKTYCAPHFDVISDIWLSLWLLSISVNDVFGKFDLSQGLFYDYLSHPFGTNTLNIWGVWVLALFEPHYHWYFWCFGNEYILIPWKIRWRAMQFMGRYFKNIKNCY